MGSEESVEVQQKMLSQLRLQISQYDHLPDLG